jgi:hypothetical protein
MAQYEDLVIDQGADVAIELELVDANGSPKDLTNYSAAAKMKRSYNSDSDDTTDFTAVISDPIEGSVVLSLTNLQTDELKKGRYLYDVEVSFVDSDSFTVVERVLEGSIEVTPSVTR